uniref:Uncharacterized protein n=1 Tax=Anguilla anguilla TaxID=7936 RepID=A0A0E9QKF9_ANGAN
MSRLAGSLTFLTLTMLGHVIYLFVYCLFLLKKQSGTVHPSLVFLQLFSNGVADTESTTAGPKLPPA